MGKFSGMLLCTDIDNTLLNSSREVTPANARAIDYFKSEGGIFTLATGRVPHGIRQVMQKAMPSVPVISHNGAALYDFESGKFIWQLELDSRAVEVLQYVDSHFPFSGLEVCKGETVYFCKVNQTVEEHRQIENFPDIREDYLNIPAPWTKALFVQKPCETEVLMDFISKSEFSGRYRFVRSTEKYYEMLHPDASKGRAMLELASRLGIPQSRTIAIGDNDNDIEMVRNAALGIAVKNASQGVKRFAAFITSDNDSDAVARVIEALDSGELKL